MGGVGIKRRSHHARPTVPAAADLKAPTKQFGKQSFPKTPFHLISILISFICAIEKETSREVEKRHPWGSGTANAFETGRMGA